MITSFPTKEEIGVWLANYGGHGYLEQWASAKSRRPTDLLFKTSVGYRKQGISS